MSKLDLIHAWRVAGAVRKHSLGEQAPEPEQHSVQCDCCCLIVAAFKKTFGVEANNATDLVALCGSVAMLALSAWLIARSHGAGHE